MRVFVARGTMVSRERSAAAGEPDDLEDYSAAGISTKKLFIDKGRSHYAK